MNGFWRTITVLAVMAFTLAAVSLVAAEDPGSGGGTTDPVPTSTTVPPDCGPDGQACPCPEPMPLLGDGPEPMPPFFCDEDTDGDGYFDSEELGAGSDPNDANSTPEAWWYGTCEDGADNDLDGAIDSDDDGCKDGCAWPVPVPGDGTEPMPLIFCDEDTDGDGYFDSEEVGAGSNPNDANSTPEVWWYGTCEDGVDNDLDGSADKADDGCLDPCETVPPEPGDPQPMAPWLCEEDSDGDGYFDSEELGAGSDPNDANSTPEVWWYGTCEDGADNDLDGATDTADDGCEDPCETTPPAPGVDPAGKPTADGGGSYPDGFYCDEDTDGDGYFDSEELGAGSDPKNAASTPEAWWYGTCKDGTDNDLDGATDSDDEGCEDPCETTPPEPGDDPTGKPTADGGVTYPDGFYCDEDSDRDGYFDSEELGAGSDPKNAASTPEGWWYGTCKDGTDNDLDGSADSDDDGCKDGCAWPVPVPGDGSEPMPPIFCDEDTDGDGYFDSDELSAGSDPNNAKSTPEVWWYGTCEDGADNDLDSDVDSEDDGCDSPKPLPGDPPKGDTDCSGEVDSTDALHILRATAQLSVPGGCEVAMDVDCTGATNASDALSILRYVAELPVNLPVACPAIGPAG